MEYVPEGTLWVRAKVFAVSEDGIGKAVYSEPMYIGEEKAPIYEGSTSATKSLVSGKTYEIWIINDGSQNSYTYSFKMAGANLATVTSDKYLVKNMQESGSAFVIGTMVSDICSSSNCFKAGEITAEENMGITISDVKTASVSDGASVTPAKVIVLEK